MGDAEDTLSKPDELGGWENPIADDGASNVDGAGAHRRGSVDLRPQTLELEIQAQVRKAQAKWTENPANFHQAAAVICLGGGKPVLQSSFPRPENVARMTHGEMQTAWTAAQNSITLQEKLVCHYTNIEGAGYILGTDSPGFRASVVGQGGGGVSVVTVGPHELDWAPYQSGQFRASTGQALWGQKAADVLLGGKDDDKLDMVFFISVPQSYFDASVKVPGRDLIRILPASVLYEQDGKHYLQKEKIVKSYILAKSIADVRVQGEEEASESPPLMKVIFFALSALMVLVQVSTLTAVWVSEFAPRCQFNLHCQRPENFCVPLPADGETYPPGIQSRRCGWCTPEVEYLFGAIYAGMNVTNATAFCSDRTMWKSDFCNNDPLIRSSTYFVERSPRTGEAIACAHPACFVCGVSSDPPVLFRATSQSQSEPDNERSSWGIISERNWIEGNAKMMLNSDKGTLLLTSLLVSWGLASEIRDVKLCEMTIEARGANTLWRLPLLAILVVRQFVVVPAVMICVPILVLYDGGDSYSIALNTVAALFLLQVDDHAFTYALPDWIRIHILEFGRAEIGEAEAQTLSLAKTWSWPLYWTVMWLPVYQVQAVDSLSWDPILNCLHYSLAAAVLGAAAEAVLDKEVGDQTSNSSTLKALGIVCLKSIVGYGIGDLAGNVIMSYSS